MRAAIFTGAGGPEVVRVDDVADPEPAAGEVLVDAATAALNRRDVWRREGDGRRPAASPARTAPGAGRTAARS